MATATTEVVEVRVVRDDAPFELQDARQWDLAAQACGFAARKPKSRYNDFTSGLLNLVASFVRAAECVSTPDCLLGCVVSVICTLLYWFYAPQVAVSMSWSPISLVVVFPISQGISMGFKRREQALGLLGDFFGNLRAIYFAVHTWKLKGKPGQAEWVRCIQSFDDEALARSRLKRLVDELLVAMCAYFDTMRWGRSRHVVGATHKCCRCCGAEEELELRSIAHEQRLLVDSSIARLQRLVQELKSRGLPGGEAHRLDSYVSKMYVAFERLAQVRAEFRNAPITERRVNAPTKEAPPPQVTHLLPLQLASPLCS